MESSGEVSPTPDQPGTLFQQFLAIGVYLNDDTRELDREVAWQRARERIIPHATRRSMDADRWRRN